MSIKMLIFAINVHIVNAIKKLLSSHFEMQDLGEADVLLGMKIKKIMMTFSCQSHYIKSMLRKFSYIHVIHVRIPYDPCI